MMAAHFIHVFFRDKNFAWCFFAWKPFRFIYFCFCTSPIPRKCRNSVATFSKHSLTTLVTSATPKRRRCRRLGRGRARREAYTASRTSMTRKTASEEKKFGRITKIDCHSSWSNRWRYHIYTFWPLILQYVISSTDILSSIFCVQAFCLQLQSKCMLCLLMSTDIYVYLCVKTFCQQTLFSTYILASYFGYRYFGYKD
jgi:hypothetical protein